VRVLIVYAHPRDDSLCAAALSRAELGLSRAGHEVEVRDLYRLGFDPALSRGEQAPPAESAEATSAVADDVRLLRWAQALVFVYPTWWGGQPAILKGWLDRVLVEGPALACWGRVNRTRPTFGDVRHVVVVTTHGSSKWVNALQGEPGKRVMLRGVRSLVSWRARSRWISAYGLDRSSDTDRTSFLDRVEDFFSSL